jgi:hypothetical protein
MGEKTASAASLERQKNRHKQPRDLTHSARLAFFELARAEALRASISESGLMDIERMCDKRA